MSEPQQSPYGPAEPTPGNPYPVTPNAAARHPRSVLGFIAFGLGILAMLIGLRSFSPFTILLVVPALVCGIIGLVEGRRTGSSPLFSILGIAFSVVPIVLFIGRRALGI